MLSIKNVKLKHQLILLFIIAILLMFFYEVYYYMQMTAISERRQNVYTQSTINELTEKFSYVANQYKLVANTISYNNATQQFLEHHTALEKIDLNVQLSNIAYTVSDTNPSISNVLLVDINKTATVFINSFDDQFLINEFVKNYNVGDPNSNLNLFLSEIRTKQNADYYFAYVKSIYSILPNSLVKTKLGDCIILFDLNYLSSLINQINMTKNSYFFVLDSANRMLAGNNKCINIVGSTIDEYTKNIINNKPDKFISYYKGKKSIIQSSVIKESNWKVVSIIPLEEINDDLKPIRNFGLIITLSIAAVLVVLGIKFNNNISRPITYIMEFLDSSDNKFIHKRLYTIEKNEIGQLAIHINNMLDEIEDITKNNLLSQTYLYESELSRKEAQLSALQSQINPHFLYNTLDCIKGIGMSLKSIEIVSITTSLSYIFRYSIKGKEIVTIREEIQSIKNYLNIISIRFPERFTFNLEVAENLMELKMIKLLLQPLVENSIYHGLEPKYGNGTLNIKCNLCENGDIIFEISDNGNGIHTKDLELINQQLSIDNPMEFLRGNNSKSIGLYNLNARIKLRYGNNYGLKIISKENEGTSVILNFPQINS